MHTNFDQYTETADLLKAIAIPCKMDFMAVSSYGNSTETSGVVRILKDLDRLEYFLQLGIKEFTRKDYMNIFKDLSSATASRDLKKGIELNRFESVGNLNKTKYIVK